MSQGVTWFVGLAVITSLASGCASSASTASKQTPQTASTTALPTVPVAAAELGGRLFDNWIAESGVDFVPDNPATAALDGKGGPFGNGTLPHRDGTPMPNQGHDYRLKNLFGWDLRGADGIDGTQALGSPHVLVPDFLNNGETRETWIERLTNGEDDIPAYGKVLSAAQIEALATFLLEVRDGALPQPADVFALTSKAQRLYTLVPGANLERGHEIFARTCARCHGADGAKAAIDDGKYSVGSFARTTAYAAWLKVLNGHPGSPMRAQLEATLSREQKSAALRDLLAALCDRTRYPRGNAIEADAADGDPRCGAYLR